MSLTADKQFDVLCRLEPKDLKVEGIESKFQLIINGVPNKPVGQQYAALPRISCDTSTEIMALKSLPPPEDVCQCAEPESITVALPADDRMRNVIASEVDRVLGEDNSLTVRCLLATDGRQRER